MKETWILLLAAALLLAGCGSGPDRHPEWDAEWTRVGDLLAAETPAGFEPEENNDTLSLSGIWYCTWKSGEGREITNAAGENAVAYDAQIYLLVTECGSPEEAERRVSEWIALEEQNYETGEITHRRYVGQHYEFLPLLAAAENNPYSLGAAAVGARGNLAISAELLCTEDFAGDAEAILGQFLLGIHYGDQEA